MQIRAFLLPLVAFIVVGCPLTPQTEDCPEYCADAVGAASMASVQNQCVAAFGAGYAVRVRACPRGLVPAACASLSEHTDGAETILCDPGDVQPDDILCCWE